MTAVAVRNPAAPTRPRLLLPPVTEPAQPPDPREVVLRHPTTRSVLLPPTEEPWSVPPARHKPEQRPEPGAMAAAIVLAAVEALSGTRPLAQLTRWVTADVLEQLNARVPARPPSTRQRATIRSKHVWQVSSHTAEVSVVVHDGDRVRAAAVRLQVHRERWRATVLQIG